jgi:Tol biopolymer transport system component
MNSIPTCLKISLSGAFLFLASVASGADATAPSVGLLESHADIGAVARAGSTQFDAATNAYTLTGGGADIWGTADAFHYGYKKVSGDIDLQADVTWTGTSATTNRKAGVMIRQSLAPDSPYADVVVHGDGHVGFQFRQTPGGPTQEVTTTIKAPVTLRLERNGTGPADTVAGPNTPNVINASVRRPGGQWQNLGSLTVVLGAEPYAGLAITAHNNAASETAVFSHVALASNLVTGPRVRETTLEIFDLATGERHTVFRENNNYEAPNWTLDGAKLLVNRRVPRANPPAPAAGAVPAVRSGDGRSGAQTLLFTIPVSGGAPVLVPTGGITNINNDHSFSFDGKWLGISASAGGNSKIFVLPADGVAPGTEPRQVTPTGPSWFHGWSPDGKTLAYCAQQRPDSDGLGDIYTIPADGSGPEVRLTTADGLDDGPEYSPDGKYIYFNSVRSGNMKVWRMKPDGSEQTQVTDADPNYNDWFGHVSPDNKNIVFVSFDKNSPPGKHDADKNVVLRLLPVDAPPGTKAKILATLYGGQGTINTPSWSPDSKRFAFVSYRYVAAPAP